MAAILLIAMFLSSIAASANWLATDQSGDTNEFGRSSADGEVMGMAIRVPIRGAQMPGGGAIECGDYPTASLHCIWFHASTSAFLRIKAAYLAEAASDTSNTMDAAGAGLPLYIMSHLSYMIPPGDYGRGWPDLTTPYGIDERKTYLVTFLVDTNPLYPVSGAAYWEESNTTDPVPLGCYIIPASSAPTAADCAAADWGSRGDVIVTSRLYAVRRFHILGYHDGVEDLWWETYFTGDTNTVWDDADGDGMINRDEYYADTRPKDSSSVFRITTNLYEGDSVQKVYLGGTSPNRVYDLRWTTNLLSSEAEWIPCDINRTGSPSAMLMTVTNMASNVYYRGSVRFP